MHDSPFCASSDENSCRIYNHACMNYKLGGYSRSTATMPDFSLAYALLARVAMRIVLDLSPCLECCTDSIIFSNSLNAWYIYMVCITFFIRIIYAVSCLTRDCQRIFRNMAHISWSMLLMFIITAACFITLTCQASFYTDWIKTALVVTVMHARSGITVKITHSIDRKSVV